MALDFHHRYSTAYYLAREFIKEPERRLKYRYPGIDGEVECEYYGECVADFDEQLHSISNHITQYRVNEKVPEIVCCSPGGGNSIEIMKLAKEKGVDTYITGISEFRGRNSIARNKQYFTELEQTGLNIIGLGHYQTECLAMKGLVADYFRDFDCRVMFFEVSWRSELLPLPPVETGGRKGLTGY